MEVTVLRAGQLVTVEAQWVVVLVTVM